jgi:hypothetical protein
MSWVVEEAVASGNAWPSILSLLMMFKKDAAER